MTEEKHTPGPWQGCLHLRSDADEKCGCGYVGGIWSTSSDLMICEMGPSGEGADMIPIPDRDEVKANARLIAAAPDMLDALKASLPHLQDNARFLRDMQAHSGKVVDAFEAVRVVEFAIAKAEGK